MEGRGRGGGGGGRRPGGGGEGGRAGDSEDPQPNLPESGTE